MFYNAIKKYGWNNIEHKLLFENLNSISAKLIEIDLIYYYKSIGLSYNITNGGQGQLGVRRYKNKNPFYKHKQSIASKLRISKAQQGTRNNMYGTKAPIAIKVNGKYLTDIATELNVPYKRFYLYFIRHNRNIEETLNFYKNKS